MTSPAAPDLLVPPFLAELCHHVRTPLYGILGTLELLLDGELDPDQRELARAAYDSAVTLQNVFEADVAAVHRQVDGDSPLWSRAR